MLEPVGPSSCKMMSPGMLITDIGNRHQPMAMPPPLITANITGSTATMGSKRRTEYIDPCQLAPLKKRKIRVRIHSCIDYTMCIVYIYYNNLQQHSENCSVGYQLFAILQVDLLAPDEKEKVLQKREKNKAAAERCRVKRRENIQKTRAEYDEHLELNEALQADIHHLRDEFTMLQELLRSHQCMLKSHA